MATSTPEIALDEKRDVEHIDQEEFGQHMHIPKREAPPLVRDLSPEERAEMEKKLRRKIDLRLMPMVIIMYVPRNGCTESRLTACQVHSQLH